MEETRILIQAALDIQKSKNEIDAQIKSISDKASRLELGVKVDAKSSKEALKEVEKTQEKINSLAKDMSRANASPEMINSVKALGTELKNVESNADLSSINKQLDILSNSFREAQQAAKQLEFDKNLEVDIQKAQVALKNLEQNLSAVGGNSELSQEFARLSTEAENLTTKADLTNFNKQVQLFKTQLSGLSGEFKATQEAAKQLEFDKNLEIDIQKAQVALRALGQEWSAIGGNAELSQEFARLSTEAENLTSKADLDNFNKQVQLFQAQAKEAGVATKSWGAEIKATVLDLAGMASATAVFMKAWDGIKQIISNIHELDTSMTEFNKVANLSASSTSKFLDEAAVTAKELSASITDVVDAQTEFKKLGYSTADAQHLGKVAIMYNNVGDSVGGVDQATSSLISTMKAFGLGVSDAMSIVDKFNEVANETSIDSGEIGSALQRSASALALAGEDLNTSIGLIVGGNEIVRDADKVGRHSCPAA